MSSRPFGAQICAKWCRKKADKKLWGVFQWLPFQVNIYSLIKITICRSRFLLPFNRLFLNFFFVVFDDPYLLFVPDVQLGRSNWRIFSLCDSLDVRRQGKFWNSRPRHERKIWKLLIEFFIESAFFNWLGTGGRWVAQGYEHPVNCYLFFYFYIRLSSFYF